MKQPSAFFIVCKTLLVCMCAQISVGNGQFVRPYDNKIHKIFLRSLFRSAPIDLLMKITPPTDEDRNKELRDVNVGPYSPFFTFKPKFIPISYFGKREDESKSEKLEYGEIKYEKRSEAESLISRDSHEYESLMKAIRKLQAEKGDSLYDIINQYDDGLQQVLELLLPPLSPEKMKEVMSLLNSMIKRRFGSWGGKKRSEFYSWGGRKKRGEIDDWFQLQEYQPLNQNLPSEINDNKTESGVYEDSRDVFSENDKPQETMPTTAKRNGKDFYPWGGKRTLPPSFYQY